MSKIEFPIAVSIPTDAAGEHSWQLIVTPDGVFGRHDTNVKGRANRWAMYVEGKGHDEEVPTDLPLVMRAGTIELDEDMVKAIVERGYATGDEASVTQALKKVIEHASLPMFIQHNKKMNDWIDEQTVAWTPEPEPVVVEAPVATVTVTEPEAPRVATVAEATAILDSGEVNIADALTIHDNVAAFTVPVKVEEFIPTKFVDHDIDAFEFLRKAMAGKWNIAITGPTGCGKSAAVYNFAVTENKHLATIPFSEATDTTSLWDEAILIPDGRGGTRSVRVLTAAGMVAKYGGIMEWQEVNGAADAMLTAIYGVLDFGRQITLSNGATVRLHPDTLIVATQNPVDAAHSHASHMSAALDRRFWPVEMGYVPEIEAKIVSSKSLRELAGEIRSAGLSQPFGTDSLVKVHKAITDFGLRQGLVGLVTMFKDPASREVVRPMVDVRGAEIAKDYGQTFQSDVAELADDDLDF
jgi:AAA domain (dynein-related subfamily)